MSGLVVCAGVAAVSQSPALLEGQKLPKYYLVWQNSRAVSSCGERHSPGSECPAVPSPVVSRHHCAKQGPSLGCFSVCRSCSHAHLLSLPLAPSLGGGEAGMMLNWLFLGCAMKRRNLGGDGTEGDVQGVGRLHAAPHLCRVRACLWD